MKRRNFLRAAMVGVGVTTFGNTLTPSAMAAPAQNGPSPYGPLQAADANGIQLPAGFTSRVVARSGQQVAGTGLLTYAASLVAASVKVLEESATPDVQILLANASFAPGPIRRCRHAPATPIEHGS